MRPALALEEIVAVWIFEQIAEQDIKDLLDDRQSRQLKEEKELKLTSKGDQTQRVES